MVCFVRSFLGRVELSIVIFVLIDLVLDWILGV